jgi:hypothetical protein
MAHQGLKNRDVTEPGKQDSARRAFLCLLVIATRGKLRCLLDRIPSISISTGWLMYFHRACVAWLAGLLTTGISLGAEYQIVNYPALQNGLEIAGVMVADDLNNDTILDFSELASWSLTIDGNTVASSDPTAGMLLSNVSISNGMIFLEDPRVSGLSEQLILAIALDAFVNYSNEPFSAEYNAQVYNGRSGPVPSPSWSQQTLASNGPNLPMPLSSGRMVIARIVPEPAQLLMMVGAILFAPQIRDRRSRLYASISWRR